MTINFPGSLDNFTNPTSASPINSPSHADQHANANDAIEALEAKVGVDGSSVVTSHDYKIAQLQSLVTSAVAGAKSIYQDVRNQSGSAFTKATPVYVSGSTGASGQLLVSAASNATEATSSKTMGITTSAISNNSNGQVISEGILEGIDTTGAADGDPVWLGVNGAKIYGLANKPSAPAHLVFLGIVIRGGQANTGSMYVKIQNGFELHELHNVEVSSLVNGNILAYDSTTQTWKNTNTLQSTSSTTPLVVKASASQSANLQEWQDSAGTILAAISSVGTIRSNIFASPTASLTYIATNFDSGIGVIASQSYQKGLIVRGAASQTANLQQWQTSTGQVNASMSSSGYFTNNIGITADNINSGITALTVLTSYANVKPLIVKGAASQTANLQEWQDSSGNILTGISSNGLIYSGKSYSSYNIESAGTLASSESIANTFNLQGKNNLLYPSTITSVGGNGWTSVTQNYGIAPDGTQTSTRYVWNSSGMCYTTPSLCNYNTYAGEIYTVSAYIKINAGTGSCALRYSTGDSSKVAGIKINLSTKTLTAVFDASDYNVLSYSLIPIGKNWYRAIATIKILVGHTNDVVMFAATDNVGDVEVWGFQLERGLSASPLTPTTNALVTTVNTLNIPYGQINLQSNASTIGLIIKSANAQTANLTEWQTNTGATIAYVDSNGSAFLNSNLQVNGVAAVGTGPQAYSQFIIQTNSATRNGLVIKAASSQTANIQEWQNNAGTILLSITSDGSIKGGNSNTISVNTASTIDTVALSSFTSMEYTLSIKQGSKIRSSKVLVHTDGTSVDSTEYGIMEMGGGISGILVTASVSSTNAILQVTITDAATTNATVKLIKTML